MRLFELDQNEITTGYYNPNEDKIGGRQLGDTRKEKLTLRKINKLKKMRALKSLEDHQRQDLLGIMYGIPEDPMAGGGGMGF